MLLLKFLQNNAEWMCAIAITIFAAVQCYLAYQQNIQNIRFKRLALANELDIVCNKFLGEKQEAREVSNWLMSNASNFIFLLNKKDRVKYTNLCAFLYSYQSIVLKNQEETAELIKHFNNLIFELDLALGNATYDLIKEKH
ncbi:MAG TPA: hypothetical protein PLG15_04760 [Candidatus Gastranaerophilaceae bacterium]|nr:hypothetical protein [Candidatus Gastranaerophilaceae bacterium]